MQSAKETAANVAASAKAGMDKTKATAQEKAERMTSRDPVQKEVATQKKEARIHEAEREKHEARGHNAAVKQVGGGTHGQDFTTGTGGGTHGQGFTTGTGGGTHGQGFTTGTGGGTYGHEYTTGTGGGHPTGGSYAAVGEEMLHGYPPGTTTTGTGAGRMGSQNPNVGGGARTGYGPGV